MNRMRTRDALKNALIPLGYRLGAVRMARMVAGRPQRLALNYHNTNARAFAQHCELFRSLGDVSDVDSFLSRDPLPRLLLTFDDGYATFVQQILPILRRAGFKAVWFVPTALIGTERCHWFDEVRCAILASKERVMAFEGARFELSGWNRERVANLITARMKRLTPEQRELAQNALYDQVGPAPEAMLASYRIASAQEIRLAAEAGIEIGSHTHTHPQLASTSDVQLEFELVHSKEILESIIDRPVRYIAYPSGDCSDRVAARARAAGYLAGWVTSPGFEIAGIDRYRLPRVGIHDQGSAAHFAVRTTPLFFKLGLQH
jgi:peptidoglycan/xylan/chitin deacetylase (PgdA/CDA1 family)